MANANAQIEDKSSRNSNILAVTIFIASLIVFYLNPFSFNVTLYKVILLLIGVGIASFVFLSSNDGSKFRAFVAQIKIELRKVVWPTREEVIKTTGVIIIVVIIIAILLWLIDAFFIWAVQLLMN